MEKQELDELYHLLRVASNAVDDGLPIPQVTYNLSRHLLAGGDYLGLLQFLGYYGSTYLTQPALDVLFKSGYRFNRVVELGAGLGWLGRGIAKAYDNCPTFFIDKRPWTMIDLVADIETTEGVDAVLEVLKPGDVLVMSELLHCLDDPIAILSMFSQWPKLIIEYSPETERYIDSWTRQITRFGGEPTELAALVHLTDQPERISSLRVEPHVVVFIPPRSDQ